MQEWKTMGRRDGPMPAAFPVVLLAVLLPVRCRLFGGRVTRQGRRRPAIGIESTKVFLFRLWMGIESGGGTAAAAFDGRGGFGGAVGETIS